MGTCITMKIPFVIPVKRVPVQTGNGYPCPRRPWTPAKAGVTVGRPTSISYEPRGGHTRRTRPALAKPPAWPLYLGELL